MARPKTTTEDDRWLIWSLLQVKHSTKVQHRITQELLREGVGICLKNDGKSKVMIGWLKSNDSEVPLIKQARETDSRYHPNCDGDDNYQSGSRHEPTRAIADSPSTAAGLMLRTSQHQGLPLIENVFPPIKQTLLPGAQGHLLARIISLRFFGYGEGPVWAL